MKNRAASNYFSNFPAILRESGPWLVIAAAVFSLFHLTSPHPWLYDRLKTVPSGFIGFWCALAALVLMSSRLARLGWKILLGTVRRIYDRLQRKPYSFGLLLASVSALFFWTFKIQHVESGDIHQFKYAAMQGSAFFVGHAPLETLLRFWLRDILYLYPDADLITIFQWQICLYGAIYVLMVLGICANLPREYRYFAPILLLISPTMEVFCGYLEVYSLPLLLEVVFLLTGLLYIKNRAAIGWVSFAYGLCFAGALWHAFLFPAYFFLLIHAWYTKKMKAIGFVFQGLIAVWPLLCSLALLSQYTNAFVGFESRFGDAANFIPSNLYAQSIGYTITSVRHIADAANETILIAFAGTVFVLARCFCDWKIVLQKLLFKADFLFYLLAAIGASTLGFTYYPQLGLPLDWDMFVFIFPCITLLGVAMMKNIFTENKWKKVVLVLVIASAGLVSAWILQNSLFWHYPALISKLGPYISLAVPDYYYRQMRIAFKHNNQQNLYWLADEALKESPDKYRQILEFMDEWVVSTLAKTPPQPFDLPGWACDIFVQPGGPPERVYVFDNKGRIFIENGEALKWIYAPAEALGNPVVGGEITANGDAIMLTDNGVLLKVAKATLEKGIAESVQWEKTQAFANFLPESMTNRDLPLRLIDMEIKGDDGHICVLDNYNRVWDAAARTLIYQGMPAYNAVRSFHFTLNYQPVAIDINNRISYDNRKARLPFKTNWFYPIVRDFILTHDDEGLLTLDLNGSVHPAGGTPLYEPLLTTDVIVDRFVKIKPVYSRDSLLLLDNRYRLYYTKIDVSSASCRAKFEGMIKSGLYTQAYRHLQEMWRKSSELTSLCYEIVDTDFIRAIRGIKMYEGLDEIPMFVDAFPISSNLIILLDRWGRLTYEIDGKCYLLDGSGLTAWPHKDAIDGAAAPKDIFFLTSDGLVWHYDSLPSIAREESPLNQQPALWADLHDYQREALWIGIETIRDGNELLAMTSEGLLVRLDLKTRNPLDRIELPAPDKTIRDFACCERGGDLAVAYTTQSGPAMVYMFFDGKAVTVPNTKFDWRAISDIILPSPEQVLVLDRFGVLHPSYSDIQFYDAASTPIADAVALKFFPSGDKALWLRSNGDKQIIRVKKE